MARPKSLESTYRESLKVYRRSREQYQSGVEARVLETTRAIFASEDPTRIQHYDNLTKYIADLASSPDLPSSIEKMLGKSVSVTPEPKKTKRRSSYLDLTEGARIIKSREKELGIKDKDMPTDAAYKQRIRYQITQGKLIPVRKKGRIKKIRRDEFEKVLPDLIKKPEQ